MTTVDPTTEATATRRPNQTPTAQVSPTIAPTDTPEDTTITLVWWTFEEISPEAEGELGSFIDNSLRAFRRVHPDTEVEVVLKRQSGKGGMLDFLRTSKQVAPSVLPDIAVLNATDLNQAYTDDLVQPLDGRLDRSIIQDLIPAARKMGTVEEKLIGIPLGLEMEHTVYNTQTFATPPLLWTDVLTGNVRYQFPAKGVNGLVNDATLAQYFSAGGKLQDDQGNPTIDETVLREVLNFYQRALENEVIDATILETATTEELWPDFLEGNADIIQTNVGQFLAKRELLNDTAWVPIPVQRYSNRPVLITHGSVLVLITDSEDLERQAAALSLIEWFLSTNNNVTWNRINGSIPTRDSAYQQISRDDPFYWGFLTEQLNAARPLPSFPGYDRIGRIIQQAVVEVVNGEATPEEATTTAIDALAQ